MSQSKVTSFYALRKNSKNQYTKNIDLPFNDGDTNSKIQNVPVFNKELKIVETDSKAKEKIQKPLISVKTTKDKIVHKTKKREPQPKTVKRATQTTKQSSKKLTKAKQIQPKVTIFYESARKCDEDKKNISKDTNLNSPVEIETVKETTENLSEKDSKVKQQVFPPPEEGTSLSKSALKFQDKSENLILNKDTAESLTVDNTVKGSVCVHDKQIVKDECFAASPKSETVADKMVPLSPKRTLASSAEGTPPKKMTFIIPEKDTFSKLSPLKTTPRKLIFGPSEEVSKSPEKEKSEELKRALASFKNKLALIRNYESNPCKLTSVISPAKEIKKSSLPTVPAYQQYSYLVDPNISSSLPLPRKYKVLSEMFRSLDNVVNILNNRKEKITFEKAKEGVKKMMKRDFSKTHFGQIVTIMPAAYVISLEKCNFKKANDPNYELIISPVIKSDENGNKQSKSSNIVTVTPQDLIHRKKQFDRNLLQLVFNHHKKFLNQMHFPPVAIESLTRWHPKFPLESVPDVEVATLPEIPENKINSAKDILNKMIKGPLQNKEKVVKALKEVAEESSSNKKIETTSPCKKTAPATKSALKGVCTDLIARIRARESVKLLECMTQSPNEIQRKAMLERLPKIMQILWHYFIAEKKAAVPVDTAIEKIIHSLNSLSSHEDIKAHLTLITEEFPGWLSFVQNSKGLYITINKNENLNEMLNKLNCK